MLISADPCYAEGVANPAWQKGMPSPNPGGRPKGASALARYVRQQTRDGKELVDRLLQLARMPATTAQARRECRAACEALLDRGFGKPLVLVDVAAEEGLAGRLAGVSDAVLDQILGLAAELEGDDDLPELPAAEVEELERGDLEILDAVLVGEESA